MITLRKVHGKSMEPTLRDGQMIAFLHSRNFQVGDVVVAFMDGREVIKRITKHKNSKAYLEGDNKKASTDSRYHGWMSDVHILGKVVWPRNL